MTIKELDDKLNSPGFQDPKSGDLLYNFFIYQYPIEQKYEIRKQIMDFKANLIRPVNYVDVLTLNLFEEFCNFLDQKKFLKHPSMLKYLKDKEKIPEMIDIFDEITDDLAASGIEFTYDFDATHDRSIKLDTGWIITLGRGLDIYDKYSKFSTSKFNQEGRRCKKCTITYNKEVGDFE